MGDFNSLPQTEIVEVQPLIDSHKLTNAALSGLITGLQDDLELARRTNELDAVSGLLNREAFVGRSSQCFRVISRRCHDHGPFEVIERTQ